MDPREAQMVYTPKKVNHLLHLVLTILTAGLWGIVWAFKALTTPSQRTQIRRYNARVQGRRFRI